jgi:hypothetical protein
MATHIDTVDSRQHQVEEDQVRLGLPERLKRPVAIGDECRLESLAAQDDPQHLCQGCVIVDD